MHCIIGHVEDDPSEVYLEEVLDVAELIADPTDFVHTPGKLRCINLNLASFYFITR